MGGLSSQVIASWVLKYDSLVSCRLRDVIFGVLKQNKNISKWSDERIYEEAEKHEKYVSKLLYEKCDEFDRDGIKPAFKIEEDGGNFFYTGFSIK